MKNTKEKNEYLKKYRQEERNKENRRKASRKWQRNHTAKIRPMCFKAYIGDPPKCMCCGETTMEFLSLDHINGGGKHHRKAINKVGNGFYDWVVKNNFPEGLQVLCHNCNLAKGFYGECPHKKQSEL